MSWVLWPGFCKEGQRKYGSYGYKLVMVMVFYVVEFWIDMNVIISNFFGVHFIPVIYSSS